MLLDKNILQKISDRLEVYLILYNLKSQWIIFKDTIFLQSNKSDGLSLYFEHFNVL